MLDLFQEKKDDELKCENSLQRLLNNEHSFEHLKIFLEESIYL